MQSNSLGKFNTNNNALKDKQSSIILNRVIRAIFNLQKGIFFNPIRILNKIFCRIIIFLIRSTGISIEETL
jgi:hypothetical protein